MKLTSTKMTKRLTLLLVAIFSWLFIGSLILFHQEHVLGKHTNAISHQYIVPKSKEKTAYLLKQQINSQKVSLFTGDFISGQHADAFMVPGTNTGLAVSPVGLFSDHPPRATRGLRAPPLA